MSDQNENVSRLPLWKTCLEKLLARGLKYGDIIPTHFFVEEMKCDPDSMEFDLGVSQIRRELEEHGMYLNGRGNKGEGFNILEPQKNASVMGDYARKAADALRRGVILGTNTKLELLSPEERARHERVLERISIKAALVARPQTVLNALSAASKKKLFLPAP